MAQKCGCIRNNFDFSLDQTSCSKITYTDRSTFQTGEDYTTTPFYTLSLELPDGSINTYNVTVGTPLSIDLGCVKPGIVVASVVSCTETFSKRAALTCSLWCGYLRSAAVTGISADTLKEIREDIQDVELIASTDFITAANLISKIERNLDRINCSCTC